MKKLLLITTILLLTGCFGDAGKGYITKECTKQENINNNKVDIKITIKSMQGNIEKLTIVETYDENMDLESITNSKKSEQNLYKQNEGITLSINKNVFTYEINVKEISDSIKERFEIKDEQHKVIKYYEEKGYSCK